MELADCDVVILCGGEGTRIRHLLPEGCPKIMADVNGTPFVDILIQHFIYNKFRRFVLCLGYGREIVKNRYNKVLWCIKAVAAQPWREEWNGPSFIFSEEMRPLGTAGAILNAKAHIKTDPFLICNGDTWAEVDCAAMLNYHLESESVITVAHDDQMRHVGTFVASKRLIGLIPETEGKYDMEKLFTLLGKLHEPVGWFRTEAEFWDIGSPLGLETFRREEPWKRTKDRSR